MMLMAACAGAGVYQDREDPQVPEAVGPQAAHALLAEIRRGRVRDSVHQVCICISHKCFDAGSVAHSSFHASQPNGQLP